jgi:hypothetical protein
MHRAGIEATDRLPSAIATKSHVAEYPTIVGPGAAPTIASGPTDMLNNIKILQS